MCLTLITFLSCQFMVWKIAEYLFLNCYCIYAYWIFFIEENRKHFIQFPVDFLLIETSFNVLFDFRSEPS